MSGVLVWAAVAVLGGLGALARFLVDAAVSARTGAARHPDAGEQPQRHAVTSVRRTRLVAITTAAKPSAMLAAA